MIPNTKDRELASSGVTATAVFGISHKDTAHIMTILRDTLYTDKIMAVEREYAANAWDANRMNGKADVPIEVHLPTDADPTFRIKDQGPGLSTEDIFNVFTQYGASTKRSDDNAVGMLGIGSKSGFAYSDSFTITSWNGGAKRVYVAALDKTNAGVLNLLFEEECGPETGLMIEIAVRPSDIRAFHERAKKLLKYFDPAPVCNLPLERPVEKRVKLENGYLHLNKDADWSERGWVAVMGCVPYAIKLEQIAADEEGRKLSKIAEDVSGVIFCEIGSVDIVASREELKYSDRTVETVRKKIHDLIDEYMEKALREIKNFQGTDWDRRIYAKYLRDLKLPLPVDEQWLVDRYADIGTDAPTSFEFQAWGSRKSRLKQVYVDEDLRIALRDDPRSLAGYSVVSDDYILVNRTDSKVSWDKIEEELKDYLKKQKCEGLPVLRISTLPWKPPYRPPAEPGKYNKKHKALVFVYNGRKPSGRTASVAWDPVPKDWQPSENDAFVVLNAFKAYYRFVEDVSETKRVADAFGIPMPKIYGYKSTSEKPLKEEDIPDGLPFRVWMVRFHDSLRSDENKELIRLHTWAEHLDTLIRPSQQKTVMRRLTKALGHEHPICMYLRGAIQKRREWWRIPLKTRKAIAELEREWRPSLDLDSQLKFVETRYPLIRHGFGNRPSWKIQALWDHTHGDDFLLYVKLMDEHHKKQESTTP